jgi:hypothetical protein
LYLRVLSVNGLPLHPLVVHAVVVLLPLAALGAVLIAARPAWRRAFGVPVLLIALVGVGAVPIATNSGDALHFALGPANPLIEVHEQRADQLLPYAVVFLVLLAVSVISGIRADRAAPAGTVAVSTQVTIVAGVLAAAAGLVVTGLVVWIGDSGASSVWQGVLPQTS